MTLRSPKGGAVRSLPAIAAGVLARLDSGDRLVAGGTVVRVRENGWKRRTTHHAWCFYRGGVADQRSVEALIRRGILTDKGERR